MNAPGTGGGAPGAEDELLFDRYFDGVLTDAERARMETLLQQSPEAARRFVRLARMDTALSRHYRRAAAENAWQEAWAEQPARIQWPPERERKNGARTRRWWGPAAAVLAHAALVLILIRWVGGPLRRPAPDPIGIDIAFEHDHAPPAPDAPPERAAPSPLPGLREPEIPVWAFDDTPAAADPFEDLLLPREGPPTPPRALPTPALREAALQAWAGRTPEDRRRIWQAEFGARAAEIEAACLRGADAIVARRREDGGWGESARDEVRHTSLVLLALLARGETPRSPSHGGDVTGGLRRLLACQQPDGRFTADGVFNAEAHGLALAAIAEAYALTRIPSLLDARDRALDAALAAQDANGLWPGTDPYESSLDAAVAHMLALRTILASPAPDERAAAILQRAADGVLRLRPARAGAPFSAGFHTVSGERLAASRSATRRAGWALRLAGVTPPPDVRRTIAAAMTGAWDPAPGGEAYEWMIATRASYAEGGRAWTRWRDRRLTSHLALQGADGLWRAGARDQNGIEATACALLSFSACASDRFAFARTPAVSADPTLHDYLALGQIGTLGSHLH